MPTLDFPEPVIVELMARIRALPAQRDTPEWSHRRRGILNARPWWRRAVGLVMLAVHVMMLEIILRTAIGPVPHRAARGAYRSLLRELRAAGWGLERRVTVAYALYAVRHRDRGTPAIRLYERTLGPEIPRSVIGWS